MRANVHQPHHCLVALTLLLFLTVAYAMSGMDMSHGGHEKPMSSLSKSMGEPINTSDPEMELTYSADGNTVIFVSGREGSIPSPGVPYSFDIWMAHKVNGKWQAPIHLGPGVDPTVGPNINTAAWELEPSLSDDGNAIYFTRYQPANLSSVQSKQGEIGSLIFALPRYILGENEIWLNCRSLDFIGPRASLRFRG